MLWKIMYWMGWLLFIATAASLLHIIRTSKSIQWQVRGIKCEGPGMVLETDWEPFAYDRDANIIYVKRRVEEVD